MSNRRLPLYLHYDKRIKQYRYRRPDNLKFYWMGSNRAEAIEAANELNQLLLQPTNLVENVLGKTETLNAFLEQRFVPFILPQRKLAKNTLKDYLNKIKVIQKTLGKKRFSELNPRLISDFLLQFPPNHANRYRAFLRFIFKYAIGEGWVDRNHAADTIPNKPQFWISA